LRCHRSSSRPFVWSLHPYRERRGVEGAPHAQSGVSVSKPASPPVRPDDFGAGRAGPGEGGRWSSQAARNRRDRLSGRSLPQRCAAQSAGV
jgi:hypothetical protein